MKTNIIFDFDGVIINSHRTKTEAFNQIFLNFGKKIGYKSRNFHLKNIGKSRYFKFKYVYKYFLRQNINKKIITELDTKFEKYTSNKIINMLLKHDAILIAEDCLPKLEELLHEYFISKSGHCFRSSYWEGIFSGSICQYLCF